MITFGQNIWSKNSNVQNILYFKAKSICAETKTWPFLVKIFGLKIWMFKTFSTSKQKVFAQKQKHDHFWSKYLAKKFKCSKHSLLQSKKYLRRNKNTITFGQNIWSKNSNARNILYFKAKSICAETKTRSLLVKIFSLKIQMLETFSTSKQKVFAQKQKHDHFQSKFSF